MARIKLSVPDAVKSAMDALDTVNWSEVARAAFEQEIYQQNQLSFGHDLQDVIERLRQSRRQADGADEEAGEHDGSNWARTQASFRHLKNIAYEEFDNGSLVSLAAQVDQALGNSGCNWADSFWRKRDFDRPPDDSYVAGFIEGAKSVWEEVEFDV